MHACHSHVLHVQDATDIAILVLNTKDCYKCMVTLATWTVCMCYCNRAFYYIIKCRVMSYAYCQIKNGREENCNFSILAILGKDVQISLIHGWTESSLYP